MLLLPLLGAMFVVWYVARAVVAFVRRRRRQPSNRRRYWRRVGRYEARRRHKRYWRSILRARGLK